MKKAAKIFGGKEKNDYLCIVKAMFDYPGRIPRGQDHIATAHLKVTILRWLLFIIREHKLLHKVLGCRCFTFYYQTF